MRLKTLDGKAIRVYLSTEEDNPDLVGNRGLFYRDTMRIVINAELPRKMMLSTLVHEFMHASLKGFFKNLSREEDVVSKCEDSMYNFLDQLKLKLPPLPVGSYALIRKARKLAGAK